jgi:hypothetical protein
MPTMTLKAQPIRLFFWGFQTDYIYQPQLQNCIQKINDTIILWPLNKMFLKTAHPHYSITITIVFNLKKVTHVL